MTQTGTNQSAEITGIILAGGAGRRMGGVDKGLLSLQGRPLIKHVIDRIGPQVNRLIIVANRNIDSYEQYGYRVVTDTLPDFSGPLVGMFAGLQACQTKQAMFVPVDAVRLPVDLVTRLMQGNHETPALATDSVGWQPLCCLLPQSHIASLQAAVMAGERSPRRWLESMPTQVIHFHDSGVIWSVNTTDELASLQQLPELAA